MSVSFKGEPVKLKGSKLEIGDNAPSVKLKGRDLGLVEIAPAGKTQIILSMPSLDTPVCASQARDFNKKIASYKGAEAVVVTMDLPFAMGRFCSTEGIDNLVVASDFLQKEFAEKYGILIADGVLEGLCARSVFVVKDGKIAYKEIVSEITEFPDEAKLDAFFANSGSCGSSCGCHH